ncbi:MAG: dUTP diphosphatase [Deferribacterota bacterium]|nr:dUTP diphosphatase [Deferribacterota bacterium]
MRDLEISKNYYKSNEQLDNAIVTIKVKALEGASIPEYKTSGASGLDICSFEDGVIPSFDVKLIRTGLYFEIPHYIEGQIRSRSGIALNNKVIVLNSPGTIDSDYRGELKIILMNLSKESFYYKKGDRLAQIVFSKVIKANLVLVDNVCDTQRGSGGFGHTGI